MTLFFACALAFVLALYISITEFFNTNSAIVFAFAKRSVWLWLYGSVYGLVAVLFLLLIYHRFIKADIGTIALAGLQPTSKVWFYAAVIGISTRSLLNISFYNIAVDGKTFPLGLATFVQTFEPRLTKLIDEDYFISFDVFLQRAVMANKHLMLVEVHEIMRERLSSRLTRSEVSSFLLQLADTKSVREAFSLYISTFGKRIFCHTFKV